MEIQSRENPKFGRKVFFVNPPLSFEHIVIDEMIFGEYRSLKFNLADVDMYYITTNFDTEKDYYTFLNTISNFLQIQNYFCMQLH